MKPSAPHLLPCCRSPNRMFCEDLHASLEMCSTLGDSSLQGPPPWPQSYLSTMLVSFPPEIQASNAERSTMHCHTLPVSRLSLYYNPLISTNSHFESCGFLTFGVVWHHCHGLEPSSPHAPLAYPSPALGWKLFGQADSIHSSKMGRKGSSWENLEKANHIFFLILILSFSKPDFDFLKCISNFPNSRLCNVKLSVIARNLMHSQICFDSHMWWQIAELNPFKPNRNISKQNLKNEEIVVHIHTHPE